MNCTMRPASRPFFLDTRRGKRFCLYHAPPPHAPMSGAILYVHPFGEEMNMSRRMAAQQARDFAAAGYGVLQIDLYGCGDSEGELRDADWEAWKEDAVCAAEWLRAQVSPAVTLWGLRLGAMLALDVACSGNVETTQCILWQPVIAGKPFMTQFLRLALAAGMINGDRVNPHDALARSEMVEVGGYELSPALVDSISRIDFSTLGRMSTPLHWFELVPNDQTLMPAARMNVARAWVDSNVDLHLHAVTGPAFWATQDVTECPRLVEETTGILLEETA